MHRLDYTVFLIYLVGISAVGVGLALKNRTARDMFAAGGESPWWTSGLSGFMTMFSAGTFVVWGGIAYEHGLVAVMINLCYGVAALMVGAFVAGRWKRLGVTTPAQFIELRFGPPAVQFYTWAMMVFRIIGVAVALYSLSVIVVAMMPLAEGNPLRDPITGNLALGWAVLIFGGIVVIYTMAGGLWAVLMTDVVQFIVLNLAILFVVPLAFGKVGGVAAFVEKAPDGFFALTTNKYTWFFMFGWVMIHFFMVGAEWAFAQRFLCVPSEKDAKKSAYLFGALYLVSPLLWLLPPMLYRVIDPNADPKEAYILACRAVLPAGMVGLMVAAMFSATASMISSQLNVFAGVLTDGFYRRRLAPGASEKRLIGAGRVFTVLLGAVLVGVALAIPYLGGAKDLIITTASLMVGPLLAPTIWGLFSRRVDFKAIWITASISFVLGVIAKLGLAKEGWLVTQVTGGLSEWIQSNETTVDLIIGIVVPIIVLFILQHLAKSTADGWNKVEQLIQETRSSGAKREASDMPAVIVGGCMMACALLMFSLMAWNERDRALLGGFGAVLLVIAGTIFAFLRMKKDKNVAGDEPRTMD